MSNNARRLAGYRLAAVPIEDVSEQLRTAYDTLTQRRSEYAEREFLDPFVQLTRPVPGTGGAKIDLMATHRPGNVPFIGDDEVVFGNSQQLSQMLKPDSPGEYNLVWNVLGGSGDLSRAQQVRIAREAARGWPEVIAELPEGAVVTNSPVGAMSGD